MDTQTTRVAQALSGWHELPDGPKFLIYPLRHRYNHHSVDLAALHGSDYQLALGVHQGCVKDGKISLLLAQVYRSRYGGVPSSGLHALRCIRDLAGIPLCQAEQDAGLISHVNLLREISYEDDRPRHDFLCTHKCESELLSRVGYVETFLDTVSTKALFQHSYRNTNNTCLFCRCF